MRRWALCLFLPTGNARKKRTLRLTKKMPSEKALPSGRSSPPTSVTSGFRLSRKLRRTADSRGRLRACSSAALKSGESPILPTSHRGYPRPKRVRRKTRIFRSSFGLHWQESTGWKALKAHKGTNESRPDVCQRKREDFLF